VIVIGLLIVAIAFSVFSIAVSLSLTEADDFQQVRSTEVVQGNSQSNVELNVRETGANTGGTG